MRERERDRESERARDNRRAFCLEFSNDFGPTASAARKRAPTRDRYKILSHWYTFRLWCYVRDAKIYRKHWWHIYNEIQWRLFCCMLFFYAICFGFGYSNMHAKLDGRWVLNVVRHYVYDIIETTEACSDMRYSHIYNLVQTHLCFSRGKKYLYKYHLL